MIVLIQGDSIFQAVLFAFVCAASGRVFLLDDLEGTLKEMYEPKQLIKFTYPGQESFIRVRRDAPPSYGPPAPAYHEPTPYHAPKAHGRVGPVYTFVKTDPQANFKWGVRHRAGAQYGR